MNESLPKIKREPSPTKLNSRSLTFGWSNAQPEIDPPSSSGLSPKPKKKPKLIPIPDGVALSVNAKDKFEIIPQIGAQFEVNGRKCSKKTDLKPGDTVTVRKYLSFKVAPKTKDQKLYCKLPTAEVQELKEEIQQMEAQLDLEKENVNQLRDELDNERQRLQEIAEKTKADIQRMEEEKVRLQKEAEDRIAKMEWDAKQRMEKLDEEMKQKEFEVKEQLAKLDLTKKQHEQDIEQMKQEQLRRIKQQELAMKEAEEKHKLALAGSAEERAAVERKMKLRENQLQALEKVLESAQYGDSDVTIRDISQIMSDVMGTSASADRKNMVFITILKANGLKELDWVEQHAPYVQIIAGGKSCKTVQAKGTLNPEWKKGSTFFFRVKDDENIQLKAFETDPWGEDLEIGNIVVPVNSLASNEKNVQIYTLEDGNGAQLEAEFLYCVWSA